MWDGWFDEVYPGTPPASDDIIHDGECSQFSQHIAVDEEKDDSEYRFADWLCLFSSVSHCASYFNVASWVTRAFSVLDSHQMAGAFSRI